MNVVFTEPGFPANQREFVRALHAASARVTAIGERPADWLDGELKSWLAGYEQVPSVTDEAMLRAAVQRVQGREWVDRLEATVEAHVLVPAAGASRLISQRPNCLMCALGPVRQMDKT